MPLTDPWGISLLIGFFGLFGLMVSWMIRQERFRAKQHDARAAALDFRPVPHPSPALIGQILALHTLKPQQILEARNIYYKHTLEADLYLFDLWDTTGDRAVLLAENAVAVCLSPNVSVPRFSLIPRQAGESQLSYTAALNLSRIVTGLQLLAFPDCPEFNRRFLIAGLEETAVRAFLTPELRGQLARIGQFHIEAAQSLITLSEVEPQICSEAERVTLIRCQLATGITLARWLSVAR